MSNQNAPHNLTIQSYSIEELFGLFDLTPKRITEHEMKQAKKRVLMLHPDKSKLPADYFLFYKKAFDVLVEFYENQNRQNQPMTEEATDYKPVNVAGHNQSTNKQINKVIDKMSAADFQNKFNKLFEDNMMQRPDNKRNEWFSKEDAMFAKTSENVSVNNMGQVFESMKQQNAGLVKYKGVEQFSGKSGANFHESVGDDEDDTYVCSDPFSKLKYDDLRKVHKDQTVFAVSESDFSKVPKYNSVDHFNRERNKQSFDPLDKQQSEHMLREQDRIMKERMMRKEYESKLKTQQYMEKNKSVLSSFLHLGNG